MGGLGSYSRGWGGADDYDSQGSGGDSDGSKMTEEERLFKYRFNIPSPEGTDKKPNLVNPGKPATKRILILDGEPFCLHEHSLFNFKDAWRTLGSFTAICLEKNQLHEKGCPLCAKNGGDDFPAFTGFFPVIDMGQVRYLGAGKVELVHEYWMNSKDEKQYRSFQKLILGAKRGSQDKPGVLKTLQFQMDKRGGDLTGTVWDVTRTGKKAAAVGDSWDFVEKILPSDFRDYLIGEGADENSIDVEIPNWHDGNYNNGIFDIDAESYYKKLAQIVGWGSSDAKVRKESRAEGASFGGGEPGGFCDDDDIPF